MTAEQSEFRFLDPGPLADGDLELVLVKTEPGDPSRAWVPAYEFDLRLSGSQTTVGHISFRVGLTEKLKRFGGNLGYGVADAHRGHKYAARGCKLLFPLARRHGLKELWITCGSSNAASRRTCEMMGARYVDTIEAEIETGQHRPTCRFIVDLRTEKFADPTGE